MYLWILQICLDPDPAEHDEQKDRAGIQYDRQRRRFANRQCNQRRIKQQITCRTCQDSNRIDLFTFGVHYAQKHDDDNDPPKEHDRFQIHHIFEQHQPGDQNARIHTEDQADRHPEFDHAQTDQHFPCRDDEAENNRNDSADQEDDIGRASHRGEQVPEDGDHGDAVEDGINVIKQAERNRKFVEFISHW